MITITGRERDGRGPDASHPAYRMPSGIAHHRFGLWHKHRAHYRGFMAETETALRRLTAERCENRRFVIFARGRSGTTLLVRLLNKPASVTCLGEVLHHAMLRPRSHIRRLAEMTPTPAFGCKILSYHLTAVQRITDPRRFFDGLQADGFRFIHLRRNTFAQCVSSLAARQSAVYHVRTGTTEAEKTRARTLRLDADAFAREIRWNCALLDLEDRIMSEFDHLRLDYETDLADAARHQAVVDRICAYVGVDSGPVEASLKKVLDRPYADLIENYADVVAALSAQGMDHVLPAA